MTDETSERTTLRLDPVGLLAVIGGVAAFVMTGAIRETFYVAIGALIGAGLGWAIRRFSRRAVAYDEASTMKHEATRDELQAEAARLGIEGRSRMDKDELVRSITAARS